MGHRIISTGYIGSEPILRPAGNSCKLEFTVLSKRPTRPRGSTDYVDVIEAARFVAWGEEAQRLSEKLRPGMDVEAIGSQESSTFTNQTTGQEETRVTFKLIHLEMVRRSMPNEQHNRQDQRQDQRQVPPQHGRHRDDGYADDGGHYSGEPVPSRNHGQNVQQRNTTQGSAQRSHQPAPQRYARSNEGGQRESSSNQGASSANRFNEVY